MFASKVKETVEVRDERSGEVVSVVIRKLSAKSLEKAAELKSLAVLKSMQAMPAGMFERASDEEKQRKTERTGDEKRKMRYNLYDRDHCLRTGLDSWSIGNGTISDKQRDDLDHETAELLFHRIIDLSLGPVDADEIRREEGNS